MWDSEARRTMVRLLVVWQEGHRVLRMLNPAPINCVIDLDNETDIRGVVVSGATRSEPRPRHYPHDAPDTV